MKKKRLEYATEMIIKVKKSNLKIVEIGIIQRWKKYTIALKTIKRWHKTFKNDI